MIFLLREISLLFLLNTANCIIILNRLSHPQSSTLSINLRSGSIFVSLGEPFRQKRENEKRAHLLHRQSPRSFWSAQGIKSFHRLIVKLDKLHWLKIQNENSALVQRKNSLPARGKRTHGSVLNTVLGRFFFFFISRSVQLVFYYVYGCTIDLFN